MGFVRETWRGEPAGAGGGYSGARWFAEERRFLTFVSRPVVSDEFVDCGFASRASAGGFENRLDSLLLDFFLSPSIVSTAE